MTPSWKVTIERASRISDGRDTEFPFEKEARAYARTQFAKGNAVRVDASDGSLTVTPAQIAAWLLGSPKEAWPEENQKADE
jgi:hypothetical protein